MWPNSSSSHNWIHHWPSEKTRRESCLSYRWSTCSKLYLACQNLTSDSLGVSVLPQVPSIPKKIRYDGEIRWRDGLRPQVHDQLQRFLLLLLLNRRSHRQPVYFVHEDIEDAFGSVNQQKLVEILRWHKSQLPPEMGLRIKLRILCGVSPTGRRSKNFNLIPHLLQSPEDWAQRLEPGTVVFDITFGRSNLLNLKTDQLIELAVRSVLEVQVTALGTGKNCHYRLQRGIPQGSRLSSALCYIYYSHMVKCHLSRFLNDEDLLVRVVDDFLYLTTHGSRALDFYKRIHKGFPDYNAYVNDTKTKTNVCIELSRTITEDDERASANWVAYLASIFRVAIQLSHYGEQGRLRSLQRIRYDSFKFTFN